jgi:HEPN domain-containing protein/predicted nucleotidyltransferase
VLQTIEEICQRLIETHDPESIILFGSRARGTATQSSDIDLLIIQESQERPIDRRIGVEKTLADRGVAIDILVYTPAEMRFLHSIGSPLIEEVIETGRVLYMRKATEQRMADAEEEFASARILHEHGKTRAVCYHCQQSVEKYLKALIIEKGDAPEKVHDIIELLRHAQRLGWTIAMEMDDAVLLNSVYKGRYPSEEGLLPHGEPTPADAARALKAASSVSDSARQLIEGARKTK